MATRPERQKLTEEVQYWNALLYADSGSGKTVFAGSDNGVLFICTEDAGRNSGTISAARMGSTAEKITVNSWEDVKNAYEWWDDNPEDLADVKVLCVDSLTEMQRLAKEYVLRETAAEKLRKNQDPEKMQLQDYGIMHDLVENMVRGLNDLPVNVLYTSTSKKVEDADKNEFLVPDIQGKGDYGLAMKMVALMTSYGYMRVELHDVPAPTEENPNAVKKVKRRVFYWEDTGTIRGKDRTCSLAPYTVNMTLQQMRLAIEGKMVRNAEGKIVKKGTPQPVAKKAAPAAPKKAAVQASPQADNAVKSEPNPANTPDTAADLTDSVPQAPGPKPEPKPETVAPQPEPTESKEGSDELELDAVEA